MRTLLVTLMLVLSWALFASTSQASLGIATVDSVSLASGFDDGKTSALLMLGIKADDTITGLPDLITSQKSWAKGAKAVSKFALERIRIFVIKEVAATGGNTDTSVQFTWGVGGDFVTVGGIPTNIGAYKTSGGDWSLFLGVDLTGSLL